MNRRLFLFSFTFFFIYADSFAMQPPLTHIPSTIIKTILLAREPQAIACINNGDGIGVIDRGLFTSWDYKNEKLIFNFKMRYPVNPSLPLMSTMYAHPKKNIVCINFGKTNVLLNDENYIPDFYELKDLSSNILFSAEEPLFFTVFQKKLKCYNYERFHNSLHELEIPLGLIFACPSQKQSHFLCSDDAQKGMYKVTQNGEQFITQKLFDFCKGIDLTNWAYAPQEGLFHAINKYDRKLYIANTKTLEQKIWSPHDDFSIATMALHPNNRILALLSRQRDQICYVDSEKLQPIITTNHVILDAGIITTKRVVLYAGMQSTLKGQKIAFFSNGREILIALGNKILVIKVPLYVSEIGTYEKYSLIRYFDIHRELQHIIVMFLLALSRHECIIEKS